MDIQAAKKRCEGATDWLQGLGMRAPWMTGEYTQGEGVEVIADDGDIVCTAFDDVVAEFIAASVSDLPAALEALEDLEHQRNEQFDRAEITDCRLADAQMALEAAQGKLEAVEAWSDKWPWSGLLGEAKRELDAILEETNEHLPPL